jgi:predicted metal-dependent hydrolase
VRCQRQAWRRYFEDGFHPSQGDGARAQRWLAEHSDLAPPVSQAARV